ncbi:hypothetical protein OG21DRAFT_1575995 [Imleria badia]|nr:hypothetical protein OG21DRAFT_1575995 [Imleria badia]
MLLRWRVRVLGQWDCDGGNRQRFQSNMFVLRRTGCPCHVGGDRDVVEAAGLCLQVISLCWRRWGWFQSNMAYIWKRTGVLMQSSRGGWHQGVLVQFTAILVVDGLGGEGGGGAEVILVRFAAMLVAYGLQDYMGGVESNDKVVLCASYVLVVSLVEMANTMELEDFCCAVSYAQRV